MTITRRLKQYKALHTKSHKAFRKRHAASLKAIDLRRVGKEIYFDGNQIVSYDWRRKYKFVGQGYAESIMGWDGIKRSRPHYSILAETFICQVDGKCSLAVQLWRWLLGAGIR